MPSVHIARHGQSLGSFSEKEIRQGIASKRFSKEDDLAWMTGMSEWRPLGEVMLARKNDGPLSANASSLKMIVEPAWERRSELGLFKALFQTILQVLFFPNQTFSNMKTTGGLGTPLLFYVITHILLVPLLCLAQVRFLKDIPALLPQLVARPSFQQIAIKYDSVSLQRLMSMGLRMMLGLFIITALLHLSLKILKSAKKPIEVTFRMFCYYSGAWAPVGALFLAIFIAVSLGPVATGTKKFIYILGVVITSCVGLRYYFIGIKKVHHLSSWQTIFVLLFGTILLPVLIMLAVVLLGVILITILEVTKYFLLH